MSRPVISRSSHTSRSSDALGQLGRRVMVHTNGIDAYPACRDCDGHEGPSRHVARRAACHAAATRRRRLRSVARDPHAQPRLARAVGAAARARLTGSGRRPRRVPVPAAARGSANASSTPRTASACSCTTARLLGEVSLGSVLRGPFQSSFIGYWIDEKHAGNGYVPEGVVLIIRYGFETLGLHRWKRRSCRATRRAGTGRGEARVARRGHGLALPADPGRLGRPRALHDHARRVGHAQARPRAPVPSLSDARLRLAADRLRS